MSPLKSSLFRLLTCHDRVLLYADNICCLAILKVSTLLLLVEMLMVVVVVVLVVVKLITKIDGLFNSYWDLCIDHAIMTLTIPTEI